MALVVDTGPLLAALDRADSNHHRCLNLLESFPEPLIIPAPVLVEVDYWIRDRLHHDVLIAFLDDIARGEFIVESLLPLDYHRVREICSQYKDSDIGLVDASVLAIVERLNELKLVTLDHRHFGMLRPRHITALQLLPE